MANIFDSYFNEEDKLPSQKAKEEVASNLFNNYFKDEPKPVEITPPPAPEKKKNIFQSAIDYVIGGIKGNAKPGINMPVTQEKKTGVTITFNKDGTQTQTPMDPKTIVPTLIDKYKEYTNSKIIKLMEDANNKMTLEKEKTNPDQNKVNKYQDTINDLNGAIGSPSLAKKYYESSTKDFKRDWGGFIGNASTLISGISDWVYKQSESGLDINKKIGAGLPKPLADLYAIQTQQKQKEATAKVALKVSDGVRKWAEEVNPTNPDFMDAVVGGLGSMGAFLTVSFLTKSPEIAMSSLEAMQESGNVYYTNRKNGMDIGQASIESDKDFAANIVVNYFTNKLGLFSDQQKGLKKALMSSAAEGSQEALQQIASNITTGRPVMEGVLESFGVGGLLGGGFSVVLPGGQVVEVTGVQDEEKVKTIAPTPTEEAKTKATEYVASKESKFREGDTIIHLSDQELSGDRPYFDAYFGTPDFAKTFGEDFVGKTKFEMTIPKDMNIPNLSDGSQQSRDIMAKTAEMLFPEDTKYIEELRSGNEQAVKDFYDMWADKKEMMLIVKSLGLDGLQLGEEYLITKDAIGKLETKTPKVQTNEKFRETTPMEEALTTRLSENVFAEKALADRFPVMQNVVSRVMDTNNARLISRTNAVVQEIAGMGNKNMDPALARKIDSLEGDLNRLTAPKEKFRTSEVFKNTDTLEKITNSKQDIYDFADYLETDTTNINKIIDDFTGYAGINELTDTQVNSLTDKFIKVGDEAVNAYSGEVETWSELKQENGEVWGQTKKMRDALTSFQTTLDALKNAKTRTDQVLALDALISAEHSRGGSMLTYGYGIPDIDRGGDFLRQTMDYIRNQKEFTSQQMAEKYLGTRLTKEKYREGGIPTSRLLEDIKGKDGVSRVHLENRINSSDLNLKQVEKDIARGILSNIKGDTINVQEFSNHMRTEFVPLEFTSSKVVKDGRTQGGGLYEFVTLPKDQRGNVTNYYEKVYTSPIKTGAGSTHFTFFPSSAVDYYFGHTRVEEMEGAPIRRVIELQTDLYQKGKLDQTIEKRAKNEWRNYLVGKDQSDLQRALNAPFPKTAAQQIKNYTTVNRLETKGTELARTAIEKEYSQLTRYNDPTAHFRMAREEARQAAIDGVATLLFPTGDTAMNIEGLSRMEAWFTENENGGASSLSADNMKVDTVIAREGMGDMPGELSDRWVVVEVLKDGQFKAVPEDVLVDAGGSGVMTAEEYLSDPAHVSVPEIFNISGKGSTDNPIYRFYEKDLGRYLKSKFGATVITDAQGVTWNKVDIKPEQATTHVEAFRIKDDFAEHGMSITTAQETQIKALNKKFFGDEDIRIVEQIVTNAKAVGSYLDGMIKILNGKADMKDTYYHEAVHKYLDIFLTSDEQVSMLLEAQKKYGGEDFAQIEENVAEDFIKYAKSREGVGGRIKVLFDKVIARINQYISGSPSIDALYADIVSGKAKEQVKTITKTAQRVKAVKSEGVVEGMKPKTVKKVTTIAEKTNILPAVKRPAGKGEVLTSRFQERVQSELLNSDPAKYEFDELTGTYNKLALDQDAKFAVSYLVKNPEKAVAVGLGLIEAPRGHTTNAIAKATALQARDEGNIKLWAEIVNSTSQRSTRMGQELVTLRGQVNDDSAESYLRRVIDSKMEKIGKNLVTDAEKGGKELTNKQKVIRKIDMEVEKATKVITEEQSKVSLAQSIIDSLRC